MKKMSIVCLAFAASLFSAAACATQGKDAANCKDQALLKTHGIETVRLKAYGSGPYAPVASNDSEEGRAKNRRVELVKQ